jgi:hypothetical protein
MLSLWFLNHDANSGSPCTWGCKPNAHASWAEAGWFTAGLGLDSGGWDVVAVVRMWRSYVTSAAVSVWGGGVRCGYCGAGDVCWNGVVCSCKMKFLAACGWGWMVYCGGVVWCWNCGVWDGGNCVCCW